MSDAIALLKSQLDELVAKMKPMHLAIAKALAEGKTQEQAYIDAGGKGKDPRHQASQLIITNHHISEYVDLAKKIASASIVNELEITEDRIMRELGCLGFHSIKDFYNEAGELLQPHELSDSAARAVTKVKETVLRTDKGSGDIVLKREYELSDKKGALQLLGNSRSIQMFREHKVIDTSLNSLIDELTSN